MMRVEKSSQAKEIFFSIKEAILQRKPISVSSTEKPLGLLPSEVIMSVSTLEINLSWTFVILASQSFSPRFTGSRLLNLPLAFLSSTQEQDV